MDWKSEALTLAANTDLSWREIARRLDQPKSTVSDYLRDTGVQNDSAPRILIFDIETSYQVSANWRTGKQYIGKQNVLIEPYVMCWTAKWLGANALIQDACEDKGPRMWNTRDDQSVCESLYELMDQADILVAHNGDNFDIKWMNARFLWHDLPPPSPYQTVDTCKVARRKFRLPKGNSLWSCADYMKLDIQKLDSGGMSLWHRCEMGEAEAWAEMLEYNAMDVEVLEQVYLKLRPWDHMHPNMALYDSENAEILCPSCGSDAMSSMEGKYYYTRTNRYRALRCEECGAVSRERLGAKSTDERRNVVVASR